MLTQDYLVRIMVQFAEVIRRSLIRSSKERDPRGAADMLEDAVGEATDIDGSVLLSLSPESIASVMQVSGVDPHVTEYIARSLLLASGYLHEAGDHGLAEIREQQARAIAEAYGHDLPGTPEELAGFLDELDSEAFEGAPEAASQASSSLSPDTPALVEKRPGDASEKGHEA